MKKKRDKVDLGVAWEFIWMEMCWVEMASTEQSKMTRRGRRGP